MARSVFACCIALLLGRAAAFAPAPSRHGVAAAGRPRLVPQPAAVPPRPLQYRGRALLQLETGKAGGATPANVASILAWISLVGFAAGFSPGQVGDPNDTALVTSLIANPTSPLDGGVSPLFALAFNLFVPVPLMLAALLLPTSRGQRVPALPFVATSAFIGFFSLGPYLALRSAPAPLGAGEAPPFAFFESRAFGAVAAALTLSIPFSSQVFQVADWPAAVSTFQGLLGSSKLVSVSCADLSVLCVSLALLVREDARRRAPGIDPNALCALSLLLPAFAPAVWMLLRPLEPGDDVE